jgi:HD-GYP domain-containing protein (c-di-GMP phosphodiesterase class II)
MVTTRVYQPAREPAEALEELRRGSGGQFCPRCVEAAERIFPQTEYAHRKPASTGEPALATSH